MLYTLKAASDYLGCSIGNLYSLKDKGLIAVVSVGANGKGYRIDETELERFVQERSNTRRMKIPAFPEKCKPVQLKHLR